jgi:hypothetical protein
MTTVPTPLHPAASHHLPSFITAPGETDVLMVAMGLILIVAVLMFGILFFRLHALPEQIAHRGHKLQFEIVAVLGLISLFTHMHIFWIAGLLLALIDLPDVGGWLDRIGTAVEKMAGIKPGQSETPLAEINPDQSPTSDGFDGPQDRSGQGPKRAAVKSKELIHA